MPTEALYVFRGKCCGCDLFIPISAQAGVPFPSTCPYHCGQRADATLSDVLHEVLQPVIFECFGMAALLGFPTSLQGASSLRALFNHIYDEWVLHGGFAPRLVVELVQSRPDFVTMLNRAAVLCKARPDKALIAAATLPGALPPEAQRVADAVAEHVRIHAPPGQPSPPTQVKTASWRR